MDRLKSILADKILDLSASNGDEVRLRIDKIQRFRDFANACQTLMKKYPQIEDELIKMVDAGDYDTKIASSRVDSIIRMADEKNVPPVKDEAAADFYTGYPEGDGEVDDDSVPTVSSVPEDIDYEELEHQPEDKDGYVPFEVVDVTGSAQQTDEPLQASATDEDMKASERKATIKKVVQVIGLILAIIVLIFVVRFVKDNWQTILIILGIAAVLFILIWFFRRKR